MYCVPQLPDLETACSRVDLHCDLVINVVSCLTHVVVFAQQCNWICWIVKDLLLWNLVAIGYVCKCE